MSRWMPFLAVAVFAAHDCGNPISGRVCTLVGCLDGLTVRFSPLSTVPYKLTVTVAGDPPTRVVDCSNLANCQGYPFFPGVSAALVTITVTTAGGSHSYVVAPQYQTTRPNGPDCPPECKQATVTLDPPTS